ncbi:GFA family protein [Pelagibaculum spongiae]|uniref:Aldehyde-activating protein n=1 Tax=Pelagibaculum spongiae TaxID=2080658 RepID=A0A2V1GWH0_9GAMM|nr:GFA family protein [Pelagibaculum spongiae]PVZ69674.1 aldehyde-activating protein [Pelagibaculum spongiae]
MSNNTNKNCQAECLCGAVKITVAAVNPQFTVCHCDTCRRWGGGPFFAVQCGEDVSFSGEESITRYASSDWATRGFCSQCGSHLFYQLNKTSSYNMPIGLFSQLDAPKMSMQYFSDQRPDYYCFSNKTKQMTTAEIMAYFSSEV